MAADDYQLYILDRKVGIWAGLAHVYRHWTGRYTATFIGIWLVDHNIPERFYFLHTLLLLFGVGAAYYFLLNSINKTFLGCAFGKVRLLAASLVLLLITLYVQAEISTGFYWFSSSITYQPPLIFSLLIAGLMIKGGVYSSKWKYLAPALILVVLTCGTTEIGPLYLLLTLLVLSVLIYRTTGKMPVALVTCLCVTLITGIIIMLTSGLFSGRLKQMNGNTSLVFFLPITLFRSASVFYFILRVPAFWVVSLLSYGLGLRLAPNEGRRASGDNKPWVLPWNGRRILVPGLLIIAACVFLSLAPILAVTGGSFPTRSLDTLVDLTMVSLLGLLFTAGLMNTRTAGLLRIPAALPLFLLIMTLTATVPLVEAWESVFSGYFYHGMVQQRKNLIRDALSEGKRTATIQPAEAGVEAMIHARFPHGIFETAHAILLKKPELIYDDNGMETGNQAIYQYYGLDSIIVKNPGH